MEETKEVKRSHLYAIFSFVLLIIGILLFFDVINIPSYYKNTLVIDFILLLSFLLGIIVLKKGKKINISKRDRYYSIVSIVISMILLLLANYLYIIALPSEIKVSIMLHNNKDNHYINNNLNHEFTWDTKYGRIYADDCAGIENTYKARLRDNCAVDCLDGGATFYDANDNEITGCPGGWVHLSDPIFWCRNFLKKLDALKSEWHKCYQK